MNLGNDINIIPARPEDHQILTDLTIKSKSYWNYSAEQINLWRDDLTITPQYISDQSVFKLAKKDIIVGYYSYLQIKETEVYLDNLFIHPDFIGQGYGEKLMNHFLNQVDLEHLKKISLHADPNATDFYLRFHFKNTGYIKSSIIHRLLPIMELKF